MLLVSLKYIFWGFRKLAPRTFLASNSHNQRSRQLRLSPGPWFTLVCDSPLAIATIESLDDMRPSRTFLTVLSKAWHCHKCDDIGFVPPKMPPRIARQQYEVLSVSQT